MSYVDKLLYSNLQTSAVCLLHYMLHASVYQIGVRKGT